jgi:hypothetical protein
MILIPMRSRLSRVEAGGGWNQAGQSSIFSPQVNATSYVRACELARQRYRIGYRFLGFAEAGVLCKGEDVCLELRELSAAKLTIS